MAPVPMANNFKANPLQSAFPEDFNQTHTQLE
jgi:hypothetical protein